MFEDVAAIRYDDRLESLARDLSDGRIDGALAARGAWARLAEGERGIGIALIGPLLIGGPFGSGVAVGLRPADAPLRHRFDRAIAEASADGTIRRLSEPWFGFDLSCWNLSVRRLHGG